MIIEKDILALIPQRPPFVMVDALVHADDNSARCRFLVTEENLFVVNGELREPGLVENMAQTAAARAGYLSSIKKEIPSIGYIGDVKNLEIVAFPKINETLDTEIRIENQIFGVTIITAQVFCKTQLLARCEMKIFIPQSK